MRGRWLTKDELDRRMKALAGDYAREAAFMGRMGRDGFEDSLAVLREARARDPKASVFRPEGIEGLALLYGVIEKHAIARQAAELAVAEFPQRWTAWTRLAEACLALGDASAAVVAFERARELHPDDPRLARALEALAYELR